MRIVHIETTKRVKKSKREIAKELAGKNENYRFLISEYKEVPAKEPTYIVAMSEKEIQLVSFYLELENRKPIMNVKIDTEIKKEKSK